MGASLRAPRIRTADRVFHLPSKKGILSRLQPADQAQNLVAQSSRETSYSDRKTTS